VANTPGVSKVLTSSNPLDDLVSIFGAAGAGGGGFGATSPAPLSLGGLSSPVGGAGAGGLGGLGGLDMFGSSPMVSTPVAPLPTQATAPKPAASTSQQEDLLGLF
jgi:AP-1 complex subunit beta-1